MATLPDKKKQRTLKYILRVYNKKGEKLNPMGIDGPSPVKKASRVLSEFDGTLSPTRLKSQNSSSSVELKESSPTRHDDLTSSIQVKSPNPVETNIKPELKLNKTSSVTAGDLLKKSTVKKRVVIVEESPSSSSE